MFWKRSKTLQYQIIRTLKFIELSLYGVLIAEVIFFTWLTVSTLVNLIF